MFILFIAILTQGSLNYQTSEHSSQKSCETALELVREVDSLHRLGGNLVSVRCVRIK